MRQITLTEYQTNPEPVFLGVDERDALAEMVPSITITPATGMVDHYHLTPASIVGAVELDDLAIQIRPKLPIRCVLFLISYMLARTKWLTQGFYFDESESLVEAIVPAYLAQIRRAFQRGLLQGYRNVEDSLATVRGQIRFGDQIRDRFGIYPPVEVRYDEFTDDILENRLIKAALGILKRKHIRSRHARSGLRSFDGILGNVTPTYFDHLALPEVHYNRLNERYRGALELAKLILQAASIELRHGPHQASSFLVDMNQVFEDFVAIALRESLGLSERQFPQSARGRRVCLDVAGRVVLQPDLSWWQANRCCFVGDVKYKRVNVPGIKHPDLYQLLAYTVATNLPSGLLVYAAGEGQPRTHEVVMLGKRLEVVALDLTGSPEEVLAQIDRLADRVIELKGDVDLPGRRRLMRSREPITVG